MLSNRLFNVLIATALIVIVALTVREAFASANLVSQRNTSKGATTLKCADLPSRYSLHTEYVEKTGTRLTYTEHGPTGVDGGLIDLLSAYRSCSR